jgi:hypothetical protein
MPFSRPESVIGMFLLSDPVMYHHVDAGDAMLGSMAASLYFLASCRKATLTSGIMVKENCEFPGPECSWLLVRASDVEQIV